jgi:putative DNA primase/helicase
VPILRGKRTAAFPMPTQSGNFAPLRQLLARLSEDDFIMLVAWCLSALFPHGPYPILILGGEAGAGKSTLARLAQRIADPINGDLLQPPGDDRDLIAAARHNRVLAFDNLSGIRAELADSLCRLATGSEIGGRALYSDHETASFSASRPLILNGIPNLAARGDLSDRSIVLSLEPLNGHITERDWWKSAEFALPSLFGALLSALTIGLNRLEAVPTPDVRMADFARLIIAAEPALPWKAGDFLAAYERSRGRATASLLEGDLVASAIRTFASEHPEGWNGLLSELYRKLTEQVPLEAKRAGGWPGNPRWFSDRLRRAAPSLRALSIAVHERRDAHGMQVIIGGSAALATSATQSPPFRAGVDATNVASAAMEQVCDPPRAVSWRVRL